MTSRDRRSGRKPRQQTVSAPIPASIKNYVNSRIHADEELKHFITFNPGSLVDFSGIVPAPLPLAVMAQSVDIGGRIGASIQVRHVELRYSVVTNPGLLAGQASVCRIMLVRVALNEQSSLPYTTAEVLDPNAFGGLNSPLAAINPRQWTNFTVMFDRTVDVSFDGEAKKSGVVQLKSNFTITFVAAAAAAANVARNAMYLVLLSDSAPLVPITVAWNVDLYYTDA